MKILSLSLLVLGALIAQEARSQLIDTIFVDYGMDCSKTGNSLGGLIPPAFSWAINIQCKNYNGSVGCHYENPTDASGKCLCNLGDDAMFDDTLKSCIGKVGAYCTAEKTDLIPPKLCVPNADCVSIQSEGHTVGKCQCIYGYRNENGLCVPSSDIPDDERSTPRTTTTTEAPDRGTVEIPLGLLLGYNTADVGETCQGPSLFPLLNRTFCNTKELTVACISDTRKCECNMGNADSVFDAEAGRCVGRTGSYCLTRENLLGIKGCVKNAYCQREGGIGTSFGTCQCLPGFEENVQDGTCKEECFGDDCPTQPPGQSSSSPGDGTGSTEPGEGGGGGSSSGTASTGNTQSTESTTAGAVKISGALASIFAFVSVLHLLA